MPNLYETNSFKEIDNKIVATISINKNHDIFSGHFPGNPVMPGVCMIQIIKELTEKALGEELFMTASSNIKFMALINPKENPVLQIEIDYEKKSDSYKIKSTTTMEKTVALKFTGNYKISKK
ncbi:MAG: 3-hydroxyacyl-ACP dehydratase [Flavobacteriales bacterium]|nr:MAG: 3-hydroxyacyl-ACP dehydratase [Flavobacteriales bacterium]PIE49008.1 MAG: 3-hydroxyacyl-ACP dehydratase [Flavobacteriales bacterium]